MCRAKRRGKHLDELGDCSIHPASGVVKTDTDAQTDTQTQTQTYRQIHKTMNIHACMCVVSFGHSYTHAPCLSLSLHPAFSCICFRFPSMQLHPALPPPTAERDCSHALVRVEGGENKDEDYHVQAVWWQAQLVAGNVAHKRTAPRWLV